MHNYRVISASVAPAEILAVLKANAYGLGLRRAAETLVEAGARYVAVACPQEVLLISDLPVNVIILGGSLPEEIPTIVERGLVASVPDLVTAQLLSQAACDQGRTARVHMNVDTGMGRLGFVPGEVPEAVRCIRALPALELEGIYSHFPAAGVRGAETMAQLAAFTALVQALDSAGLEIRWRHIANSAAVAGMNGAVQAPFTMVRPGLDLHGAHLSITPRPYRTRPVLSLKSRLIAVRHLPLGATVGYGRTYTVIDEEGERIGTIPVGYADGYPRCLSNVGTVLVRGRRCRVVGLVCMDYTMVSLRGVPDAGPGDEVVFIGSQEDEAISIAEVAREAKTIPYELMCGLGQRVERVYI
jgi:alanine racemase